MGEDTQVKQIWEEKLLEKKDQKGNELMNNVDIYEEDKKEKNITVETLKRLGK